MNNEKRVERLFHDRIRVVRASLTAEHHVEEVAAVAAFRFRVHERFTDTCLVGKCGNRADLGNETSGREFKCTCDVFVVVETRREKTHGIHHGREDTHRVGSRRHFTEEVQQVLVQQGVFRQERTEMAQLFLVREFTVNQEPSGFRERRLFCKIFNGVSSIAQHTMFAIDERDRAFGATGVQVTVIQRDKA